MGFSQFNILQRLRGLPSARARPQTGDGQNNDNLFGPNQNVDSLTVDPSDQILAAHDTLGIGSALSFGAFKQALASSGAADTSLTLSDVVGDSQSALVPSNAFAPSPALAAGASPPSGSMSAASAPSSDGSLASGSTSSGSTQTVGHAGGLVFVNTYDPSCSAAFENCIVGAEEELSTLFTNSVTINLYFKESFDGIDGDLLGNSWGNSIPVSYATLRSALLSSSGGHSDVLPSTDPNPRGGLDWSLPGAYARMLGLNSNHPAIDDTVTLNASYNWSFGQDVIQGVMHEITEGGMGRVGGLGDQNNLWSTMDLFRYNSSRRPDYTDGRDGQTTYFSSDGGATLSSSAGLSFNNEYNIFGTKVNGGDTADWAQQAIFGEGAPGGALPLTPTELNVMAALG